MPKCLSKAYACASMSLWVGISAITLLITIVIYLKPVMQVIRYAKTSCRIESTFYLKQYICKCAYGCKSLYPCYIVYVSFNSSGDDILLVPLFIDDVQKRFVQESSGNTLETCSLRICKEDRHENRAAVLQFQKHIENSKPYIDCLYDPWYPKTGVVLQIVWPEIKVFHAVFWPFISLLFGITVCTFFCRWCRKKEDLIPKKMDKKTKDSSETKSLTKKESVKTNSIEVADLEPYCSSNVEQNCRNSKWKKRKPLSNSLEVVKMEANSSHVEYSRIRKKDVPNSIGIVELEPSYNKMTPANWPKRKPVPNSIEIIDLTGDRVEEGKGSRTRRKPLLSL